MDPKTGQSKVDLEYRRQLLLLPLRLVIGWGQITTAVTPGLFTAIANVQGMPAAVVPRFRNNQELFSSELAAQLDAQNRWVARRIDLGPDTDLVIPELTER